MKYRLLSLPAFCLLLNACNPFAADVSETASDSFVQTVTATDTDGSRTQMLLPNFTALLAQEGSAVVNIQAMRDNAGNPYADGRLGEDPFYEFFRRLQPETEEHGSNDHNFGSGFIISSDGYILTNAHVVSGMNNIKVVLNSRREYRAELVGLDIQSDVALLKIEAADLPVVKIGQPKDLQVGEWVAAIGAPFGFENSLTAGIVSAKGRSLPSESYTPFIQTDVAINPGNSGGPLFNLKGQVVGINSQIYSRSGGFMGISFAIPIDVAMNVADQLRQTGRVERGRLGVVIQEVSYDLARSFGLETANGALISQVLPDTPAAAAGLKAGDVVLGVNGEAINASSDLPVLVGMMRPGTEIRLDIWRNGKAEEISLTLSSTREQTAAQNSGSLNRHSEHGERFTFTAGGLHLAPAENGGLTVLAAVGAAQRAGLRPGDVILAADNMAVNDAESWQQAIGDGASTIALLIQRGGSRIFLALDLRN